MSGKVWVQQQMAKSKLLSATTLGMAIFEAINKVTQAEKANYKMENEWEMSSALKEMKCWPLIFFFFNISILLIYIKKYYKLWHICQCMWGTHIPLSETQKWTIGAMTMKQHIQCRAFRVSFKQVLLKPTYIYIKQSIHM